jgi:hypothetical protein
MLLESLLKQKPPQASQEEAAFRQEHPPSIGKASDVIWPILLGQEEVNHDSLLIPRQQFHQDDCCVSNVHDQDNGLFTFSSLCERAPEERTSAPHERASDVRVRAQQEVGVSPSSCRGYNKLLGKIQA